MNENQAMLVAFLLSDGSVYFDKSKRTYCIQFTNKVGALLEKFIFLMREWFALENFRINHCARAESIRFFSKNAADELFALSPTYRTLVFPDGTFPNAIIPQEIIGDEKLAIAFLKAFASCDGGIVVNPPEGQYRIELACRHPSLKKQLGELLAKTGFECVLTKERVIVRGKGNIVRYLGKIGFLNESTICKKSLHYGLPKMKVFSLLVQKTPSQTTHLQRSSADEAK
ncbi:hypothetical protein HY095_05280 [Candidatus Micrarchaeota archaeon]|nr:hypothetical protein [Candidatus Micrarchaeota archaeon]